MKPEITKGTKLKKAAGWVWRALVPGDWLLLASFWVIGIAVGGGWIMGGLVMALVALVCMREWQDGRAAGFDQGELIGRLKQKRESVRRVRDLLRDERRRARAGDN